MKADEVREVAMDAATDQFRAMPTSNPWDYAHAVVKALREKGLLREDPE